eukprot:3730552-Heterocapsa_arctica.AAC.1
MDEKVRLRDMCKDCNLFRKTKSRAVVSAVRRHTVANCVSWPLQHIQKKRKQEGEGKRETQRGEKGARKGGEKKQDGCRVEYHLPMKQMIQLGSDRGLNKNNPGYICHVDYGCRSQGSRIHERNTSGSLSS